jgi:hypothetical protein
MLDVALLQNVFFGFWYCFGDYFLLIMGYTIFVAVIFGIIHALTR